MVGTVIAAARLQPQAYRAVANEARFWPAAMVVVALGAISHALLGVSWALSGGWAPIVSIVPALVSNLDLWVGISIVGSAGGRLLGSTQSIAGVARVVGVAMLPLLVYGLGAFWTPILVVMGVWWLATTFVGLLAALGLGVLRTVPIAIAGLVAGGLLAYLTTPALAELLG